MPSIRDGKFSKQNQTTKPGDPTGSIDLSNTETVKAAAQMAYGRRQA